MATTTISIATDVHELLCKLRASPTESFSSVLRRELTLPLKTCGEVLDYFEEKGVPTADRQFRQSMLRGRGRRSRRSQ